MNWARHFTAVFILGTCTAVACGDGDDDSGFEENAAGTGADAGNGASDAGQPGSGASTSGGNGNGDSGGEGGGGATGPTPNAGNGGTPASEGGAAGMGAGGDQSPPDPECTGFGLLCEADGDCCSDACDPVSHTCSSAIDECKPAGEMCDGGTDCCTFHCVNGLCSDQACISDNQACEADVECCGGKCVDLLCQPLNPLCATAGNDCSDSGDCCSQLCADDGKCSLGASFCIQPGDACVRNPDCCSGECNIAEGALVGTCAVPPSASTFCSGVDGVICNDCGDCCSRLCAPYGDSGVKVCQPVSGCHSTGDLCRTDEDCCGGRIDEELPGYSNGQCEIEPGRAIGICRNPVNGEENPAGACSPQGNVCHFKDYACGVSSARANCCDGLGANGTCKLDPLGVPRCDGLGDDCREVGETCASSGDCCPDPVTGEYPPCVPDENGVLRCGADECVPSGDDCTIDADCCAPLMCVRAPGATSGTCGEPTSECTKYFQQCANSAECCGAEDDPPVQCLDGRCKYPPQ